MKKISHRPSKCLSRFVFLSGGIENSSPDATPLTAKELAEKRTESNAKQRELTAAKQGYNKAAAEVNSERVQELRTINSDDHFEEVLGKKKEAATALVPEIAEFKELDNLPGPEYREALSALAEKLGVSDSEFLTILPSIETALEKRVNEKAEELARQQINDEKTKINTEFQTILKSKYDEMVTPAEQEQQLAETAYQEYQKSFDNLDSKFQQEAESSVEGERRWNVKEKKNALAKESKEFNAADAADNAAFSRLQKATDALRVAEASFETEKGKINSERDDALYKIDTDEHFEAVLDEKKEGAAAHVPEVAEFKNLDTLLGRKYHEALAALATKLDVSDSEHDEVLASIEEALEEKVEDKAKELAKKQVESDLKQVNDKYDGLVEAVGEKLDLPTAEVQKIQKERRITLRKKANELREKKEAAEDLAEAEDLLDTKWYEFTEKGEKNSLIAERKKSQKEAYGKTPVVEAVVADAEVTVEEEPVIEEVVEDPIKVAEAAKIERQNKIDATYNGPGEEFLREALTEAERTEIGITDEMFTKKVPSPKRKGFDVLEGIIKYQEFMNEQGIALAVDGLKGGDVEASLTTRRDNVLLAERKKEREDAKDITAMASRQTTKIVSENKPGEALADDRKLAPKDKIETPEALEEKQYLAQRGNVPTELVDHRLVRRADEQAEKGDHEKALSFLSKLRNKILPPKEETLVAEVKNEEVEKGQETLDKEGIHSAVEMAMDNFKQSDKGPKALATAIIDTRNLMSTDQNLSDVAKEYILSDKFSTLVYDLATKEGLDESSLQKTEKPDEVVQSPVEKITYPKLEINEGYDKQASIDLQVLDHHEMNGDFTGLNTLAEKYEDAGESLEKYQKELEAAKESTDRFVHMDVARLEGFVEHAMEDQKEAAAALSKETANYEKFRKAVKEGTFSGNGRINSFSYDIKKAS